MEKKKKLSKQALDRTLRDLEFDTSKPSISRNAPDKLARPGASMKELRQKFSGSKVFADLPTGGTSDDSVLPQEVEVRRVRVKKTSADPADDPGPRTVIISKKGGLIGSQG